MATHSVSELVSLEGKCAIVTGAAQGFGAAISRRLGEAGATVFVADRNVEGAEQSAEGIDVEAQWDGIKDRTRSGASAIPTMWRGPYCSSPPTWRPS